MTFHAEERAAVGRSSKAGLTPPQTGMCRQPGMARRWQALRRRKTPGGIFLGQAPHSTLGCRTQSCSGTAVQRKQTPFFSPLLASLARRTPLADLTGLTSPGIFRTFEANNPAHFLQQVHGIRRWSPTPGTAGSGPPPASPTRPTGAPGPRGRSPTPTTSRTRTRLPAWSPFMGVDQWRRVLGLCQPGEPFDMTSRSGVRSGIAEEYTIYVTYYFLGIVAFMTTRVVPLDFDSVLMPCCSSRISENAK